MMSHVTRKRILNRTVSEQDKVLQLLDAVEKVIQQDKQNFYKFADVLEKNQSMQHLCGKLKVACGERNDYTD